MNIFRKNMHYRGILNWVIILLLILVKELECKRFLILRNAISKNMRSNMDKLKKIK
jgi:hypothetical protein